ncbi:MAG: hypothetical protein SFU27_06585 [Thermonemataceae bacterium]|nr:hypothetical protein [Thermonemataceae bacterium]
MKQIKFNTGGQPYRNPDFETQQAEIYKAIEGQLNDTGAAVVSGCHLTGTNLSTGLVFLEGKLRELTETSISSFPCYIVAAAPIESDSRAHADSIARTTKISYNAEITYEIPATGQYIEVTGSGCSRRLQHSIVNASGLPANWSYVECVRFAPPTTALQSVAANNTVPVNFATEIDDLNEYNATTGEFVASQNGIYNISFGGRSVSEGGGFSFNIQFWDGSAWKNIAFTLQHVTNIQSTVMCSANKKLLTGQKVRCVFYNAATAVRYIDEAFLSITRIA